MIEEKMIELESQLSHQDFLLEKLNQVICSQQKSIDQLETKLSLLAQRIKQMTLAETEIGPANEKPPHY